MAGAPHEIIWNLATSTVVSRTLHVVAELGVADHIGDSTVTSKELATLCGADPDGLHRALRLLSACGVFEHDGDGFRHNEASRLLRSDDQMSMRAFPRMMGMPSFSTSFGNLDHAIRTGAPAFELVDPEGLFAHLRRHPDEAGVFAASMTSKAGADIAAVLHAYDFSRFATIADIGGGRGHLLSAVLDAAPSARGILFDLPDVIDAVDIEHDRLGLAAGDFFVDPVPAADAYVLMEVVHDWADAEVAAIFSAVRAGASPGATLLIIEAVVDEERSDPRVHTLDIIMLAITGGRERTARQLRQLLGSAGFRLESVVETPGTLRIVEAVAV